MAVAKDATSMIGTNPAQATQTVSHTATGSNRLLLIGAAFDSDATGRSVSSVTYGGQNATYSGHRVYPNNTVAGGMEELWYIKEALMPASPATADIVVTFSISSSVLKSIYAISLTGVDQTTPIGTPVDAFGNGTTPSVTVSSGSGNMVVDFVCTGGVFSACAQTPNFIQQAGTGLEAAAGHTGLSWAAGAASVTNSWTFGSDWWASIGVEVKAAGETPGAGFMWLFS